MGSRKTTRSPDARHRNRSRRRTVDGVELPAAGTWSIDASHSSVNFKVNHLGLAKTRRRFTRFDGTVEIGEDPADTVVTVEIDAASVNTHDPGATSTYAAPTSST